MARRPQYLDRQAPALSARLRAVNDERGLTLIELSIAVLVFALFASGVALTLGNSLDLSRNNRNRSVAANLAAAEMDNVRSLEFDTLTPGRVTTTKTVDSIAYTIHRDSEWIAKSATAGACDSPGGSKPAFLRVTVSVLWPNMSGAKPPQSQTVISPPVGAYDPASGHIAVKVLDREALPSADHAVTVVGASGSQVQTTVEGCAFFAYLAPGSYTISLGTPGYVDQDGNGAPSAVAGVTVGGITSIQFDYDAASTFDLTLGDASYPLPQSLSMPVTVANPGLALGTKVTAGSGPLRTVTDLFPYLDGYRTWVGDCIDNDPGSFATIVVSDPGQTTASSVAMKHLEVTVQRGGIPAPGEQVLATHAVDSSCASGYDLVLGTTDANGVLKVSMPYGGWRLSSAGAQLDVLVDPATADPQVEVVSAP